MLDDLTLNVDNNSILMEKENRPSLIAIVAFATAKDIDLDTWIVEYFKKTHLYLPDQAKKLPVNERGFERVSERQIAG